MKIIYIYIILLISLVYCSLSQNLEDYDSLTNSIDYTLKPRFGVFFNYNFLFHSANFQDLPGINTCCPQYSSITDKGLSFGALFEHSLNNQMRIGGRLSLNLYNGTFTSIETKPIIIDGKTQDGKIAFNLDTKFAYLAIEPMFLYSFYPNFWTNIGFTLGFASHSDHYQSEEIITPNDRGTFTDGFRKHDLSFGEIPSISSVSYGFQIGTSYETKLNKDSSLILAPEINYAYNFNSVVSGINWNIHSIKLGLAVKYRQSQPPPPPPPPPIRPPFPNPQLPEAPPELTADVQLFKVDSAGNLNKNFSLQIEDFISLNMRPLLNYIFFDYNQDIIPNRYKRLTNKEANEFSLKKLQNLNALETYYQVLNIIGYRLKNDSSTSVDIVGCNSNIDDEKNNKRLSENRALAVRDYLAEVWGIADERMKIISKNLPSKPSKSDDSTSAEENRRVEIITKNDNIMAPVTTTDTMRTVQTYDMKFVNSWKSDVGINKWVLKAELDNKNIFDKSGSGTPDSTINWTLDEDSKILKNSGNIFYYLTVTDNLGQTAISSKNRLPIEQLTIDKKRLERISDKEFEYYSLILFDFGKSDLRKEHKSVVDLIKGRISKDSKIYVKGYTDSIGEEEDNKKLSDKRAKSVAKRLSIPEEFVTGIGESSLLYPNNTPEGRFYCRTVQIVIETPVSE
ncbi:MAG TPA: OmpA family protein [Candidatus Kapabacteria bacterium]|nr:OmpA family protein [Candidatus Kapabacteria bacterium]